ncbi:hypothetical protein AA0115_g2913 [Alternaria tenuissima]|jgi:hypothetical protein|uniref:Uncharacterized protein n=1 Tax=Alternaria tenuissima TaxID=119927 RepID=A0AB37WRC4_9PLEO|nr:hypothetical protein AA0115_g2913 [Alternaria tenuissima]
MPFVSNNGDLTFAPEYAARYLFAGRDRMDSWVMIDSLAGIDCSSGALMEKGGDVCGVDCSAVDCCGGDEFGATVCAEDRGTENCEIPYFAINSAQSAVYNSAENMKGWFTTDVDGLDFSTDGI